MSAQGKKIGVVLAGCGYLDGAEIHEATLTLLALDRLGAEVIAMAPNKEQAHVVDHQKSEPVESASARNVFDESARISRGNLHELSSVNADDLDALILPGGFGAAKNLCDFAFKGADMTVDETLATLIQNIHSAGKPLGFICIAPAIAAKVLGEAKPKLTIGNDPDTAAAINGFGAESMWTVPLMKLLWTNASRLFQHPLTCSGHRLLRWQKASTSWLKRLSPTSRQLTHHSSQKKKKAVSLTRLFHF